MAKKITYTQMIEERESDIAFWQRRYDANPSLYNKSKIRHAKGMRDYWKGLKQADENKS